MEKKKRLITKKMNTKTRTEEGKNYTRLGGEGDSQETAQKT